MTERDNPPIPSRNCNKVSTRHSAAVKIVRWHARCEVGVTICENRENKGMADEMEVEIRLKSGFFSNRARIDTQFFPELRHWGACSHHPLRRHIEFRFDAV